MSTTGLFLLSSMLFTTSARAAEPHPTLQQQLVKEDVVVARAKRQA